MYATISKRRSSVGCWLCVAGGVLLLAQAVGLRGKITYAEPPANAAQAPAANGAVSAAGAANASKFATARSTAANPLNAGRAYGYLQQICALGSRKSGSEGMRKQLQLLRDHFHQLGGIVGFQQFFAVNPLGGPNVQMINLIVRWHPEKKERILLCAHFDTRPLPDRDPNPAQRERGVFLGANDGASGVAVLMELAHWMPQLDIRYGVDFALFDGEELVYDEDDRYFLGSEWFAREYVRKRPAHRYRWGVLLDMVGDADLQIYQERHSVSWRDTRPLVAELWGTAQRLGVKEFIAQPKHQLQDDHIPLRHIAGIPTCNIIDFDYPAWHTTADVPANCSGDSLAKVGWVVYEWLKQQGPATNAE